MKYPNYFFTTKKKKKSQPMFTIIPRSSKGKYIKALFQNKNQRFQLCSTFKEFQKYEQCRGWDYSIVKHLTACMTPTALQNQEKNGAIIVTCHILEYVNYKW